jgi:hypothetical protein
VRWFLKHVCEVSVQEGYIYLRKHKESRRVQEMALDVFLINGGRFLKAIPGRKGFFYVLSRREALRVIAAKLRELPDRTWIDPAPVNTKKHC